jgi:phenylacetate-CoA ligase
MNVTRHLVFGRPETGPLTPSQIHAILREARENASRVAELPVDDVLRILVRVGQAFAPGSPLQKELLERLPLEIGFSKEMVALELSGLHMALSRPFLEDKLAAELGRTDAVDLWHRRPGCPLFQRAVPRGVVLHVASGNVSTTGVLSLIEGLLTRNVNVLKAASAATTLPLRFAETLLACDPEGFLSPAMAVLVWSGAHEKHHEIFKKESDAIVVWGGDDVVATYQQGLGPQTRLITYGPKVSVALVGSESLSDENIEATAQAAARDVALWDQNACSSAQAIYIEDPNQDRAGHFVKALSAHLDIAADEIPMGTLDIHEKAEITKERELALAEELLGGAQLVCPTRPGKTQAWTIRLDHHPAFTLSPLYRTVAVKPVARLEMAIAQMVPWRPYFQTAGLSVLPARAASLAQALVHAGAHRVTKVGEMSQGAPGEPHDGLYGLGELVRWASLDFREARDSYDSLHMLDNERMKRLSWARRKRLVEEILPAAPLWQARLANKSLRTEDDWLSLPQLTKADLMTHTPPGGTGLLTSETSPQGGHWLRTGGSSGNPKLSIFSFSDYEADMERAARGAWLAGLRPGDRVANLFFTGDLYGSFLSLNRVLELIGVNSFPLTHTAPVESVMTCLRQFQIDTVMGLSTHVQAVLAAVAASPDGITVRRIYYAGEPFHDTERDRLRQTLGITQIASVGYGGVDAGPMGFACSACLGNEHHVHEDHVYLEIIDPETGLPCPVGQIGEVLVTSLNRRLMPLLRYQVGDLARWLPGPCPCGLTGPRLELMGRVDDRIRLNGASINYNDLQALVASFSTLGGSPQVLLSPNDELTLRVEALKSNVKAEISQLRALLLTQIPALEGLVWSLEVVKPGKLERVGRAGKVIRVIDRRTT